MKPLAGWTAPLSRELQRRLEERRQDRGSYSWEQLARAATRHLPRSAHGLVVSQSQVRRLFECPSLQNLHVVYAVAKELGLDMGDVMALLFTSE